jgi:hypothetical protein
VALRLEKQKLNRETDMPVLDAKALQDDPKGAAFLLKVLRRQTSGRCRIVPPRDARPDRTTIRRAEVIEGSDSGR